MNLLELRDLSFFKHTDCPAGLGAKVLEIFHIDFELASGLIPICSSEVQKQQGAGVFYEV